MMVKTIYIALLMPGWVLADNHHTFCPFELKEWYSADCSGPPASPLPCLPMGFAMKTQQTLPWLMDLVNTIQRFAMTMASFSFRKVAASWMIAEKLCPAL